MRFLAFSGLRHHLARLGPVIGALEADGHVVELLTGQNFWSPAAHDFELAARASGREALFLSDFHEDPACGARARALETATARAIAAATDVGVAPPSWVADGSLGHALFEAQDDYAAARHVLSRGAFDGVLVLHECNFWTRSLAAAAAAESIPLFSFQEGELADVAPDRLLRELGLQSIRAFLWGPRARDRLVAAGSDSARLLVTGPPHLDRVLDLPQSPTAARRALGLAERPTLAVVAPSQRHYPWPSDLAPTLSRFVAADPGLQLVIKWAPGEDHPSRPAVERLGADLLGDRAIFLEGADPHLVLLAADAVLGSASTLNSEAIALGRPFLELAWGEAARRPEALALSLARLAGVEQIRGPEDLPRIPAYVQGEVPPEVARSARIFAVDTFGPLDGQAAARCRDEIVPIAASPAARPPAPAATRRPGLQR